ncbi:hypothetical protein BOTBODRAFT_379197 [Botryobasidium botryosum FD-172 SS1]|uniref:Uncharacterized protein n=1 Tax=Botryobasidium botryosum (strain FD-172 SS1) TaxID=930990 RepID=A0A067N7W5_BOTB1|nr:hypothetical protein BOTBODRAFT_379197 [Botryobasidium botryosum FD-172 SS1]
MRIVAHESRASASRRGWFWHRVRCAPPFTLALFPPRFRCASRVYLLSRTRGWLAEMTAVARRLRFTSPLGQEGRRVDVDPCPCRLASACRGVGAGDGLFSFFRAPLSVRAQRGTVSLVSFLFFLQLLEQH